MSAAENKKKTSIEELKSAQNGLDIWREVEAWAHTGYESIPEEKFDLMKWYGIYQQRPNVGHFMMRIRVPGGKLTSRQAREVASISREYCRGLLDVTVRQNFQLHWLTIETIPEAVRRLHSVGLTTTMACGDVPRNITACPLAGKTKDEIVDARPLVRNLNRTFVGNRDFSNLPRKYKIAVSGCALHCPQPEINDIGLYGAIKADGTKGFNLMVGGGLSTKPLFGKVVNAFVSPEEGVEVCVAITEIYREMGYRDRRSKSRMKFLVEDMGAEAFRAEMVKRLGHDLEPAAEAHLPSQTFRDHVGIVEQNDSGMSTLGFVTPSGRITPEDLFVAADVADMFGSGKLANSCMQNLLVMDIPEDRLQDAQDMALNAPTLTLKFNPIRAGMVVCTGIEFCNLALVETKHRSFGLLEYLDREVRLDTPIKISISGCPNSCSQFQAADIGLRGGVTRVGDETVEAYDIFVGAEMGEDPKFSQRLKKSIPADDIGPEIAQMLKAYLRDRKQEETFQEYTRRMQTMSFEI